MRSRDQLCLNQHCNRDDFFLKSNNRAKLLHSFLHPLHGNVLIE